MASPIVISILANASQANKTFDATATRAQKVGAGFRKLRAPALVAAAGVVALGKKLETAGEAASTADARTKQIFKSIGVLGNGYDKAAARVTKSAEKMARATGIDPNAIKSGQAVLGTFSKVAASADKAGGAFDRATALSADLASAGFGSVKSSSVLLGKALQDPVGGMSALKRVGVTLTKEQQAQVKSFEAAGKSAEAQNVILKAVEAQVGGVAKATANSSDKQRVAHQLTQETLGKKLAPAFEKIRAVITSVTELIAKHTTIFLVLVGILGALAVAVLAVNAAMAVTAALTVILSSPILLVVAAIGLLVGALVLAYRKSETFQAIVQGAFALVLGAAKSLWAGATAAFNVGAAVVRKIGAAIRGYIGLYVAAFRLIITAAGAVLGAIRSKFSAVVSYMRSVPGKIKGALSGAKTLLTGIGRSVIEGLVSGIKNATHLVTGAISAVKNKVVSGLKGALKINSPSKVVIPMGESVTEGLAVGIGKGQAFVDKSLAKVSRVVASTTIGSPDFTFGLDDKGKTGLAFAGRAGTTVIQHITVEVSDSMTDIERGRQVKAWIKAAEKVGAA